MAQTLYSRPLGSGIEEELRMSKSKRQNSAVPIRVVCAVLFLCFTFGFLYFYQADVLMATQHLLSGGKTHYDRTIGAVLITIALYMLHLAVLGATKLTRHAHALSYFPSLLALTVLTGIHIHNDGTYDYGYWWLATPILLVLFIVAVILIRQWQQFDRKSSLAPFTAASWWQNLMLMAAMFLFVGFFSNHDDVMHYRLRVESCMLHRNYQEAVMAGKGSLATDSNLTMLRIHALARSHQLGERLFEYPIVGGSAVMMPDSNSLRPVFFPIYRLVKYPARDFRLGRHLLDRNLDAFVAELMRDSAATDSAFFDNQPKHYREALMLYNRRKAKPVYQNPTLEADYEDFLKIYREKADVHARSSRLRDVYGNTYWYYYFTK